MPPKRQKKVQPTGEQGEDQAQPQKEKNKSNEKFSCNCGKTYGSLAAVHTHINNKHQDQKKKYKGLIINPKKSGAQPSTSIRMKDILYPEDQAELMCIADIALKDVYDSYKTTHPDLDKVKENNILIEINDNLSDDSDSDIDEYLEDIMEEGVQLETKKTVSKRQEAINNLVNNLKERFELSDILKNTQGIPEFESFKIKKFRLSLIRELSKFFKPDFASYVEFSLQLIHAIQKEEALKEKLTTILQTVWNEANSPAIQDIIEKYYNDWNQCRFNYQQYKSKIKQQPEQN